MQKSRSQVQIINVNKKNDVIDSLDSFLILWIQVSKFDQKIRHFALVAVIPDTDRYACVDRTVQDGPNQQQ